MALTRTASLALTRLAAFYPSGSSERRVLLAYLKAAGAGEDHHARMQFLGGLMKQTADKAQRNVTKGDTQPYIAAMLEHGFKPEVAEAWMKRGTDFGLYTVVQRAAASQVGGMSENTSPGAKGVSGEDIAQVMSFGCIEYPGMIYDRKENKYKDRTSPAFPKGQSLYYLMGVQFLKGNKTGGLRQLKGLLASYAKSRTKNWLSSVDAGANVKFEYDPEGQLIEDTGNYEPPPLEEFLAQALYLRQINNLMERSLASSPGQLRVWKGVVDGMKKNKNVLKYKEKGAGKGDLTIEAKKLRDHMVEMIEAEYGDGEVDPTTDKPYIDGVPTTQGLQKSFSKILPKMLAAMEDKLALGVKGLSSKEKAFFKDRDIAEVYRDSIRRRASRQINASERSAMIRLAATLPVGSPERKIILAGCEKMKSPAMVQNCEDMKAGKKPGKGKSKAKSDDKKDDGKMPADLLEKFKAKKAAPKTARPMSRGAQRLLAQLQANPDSILPFKAAVPVMEKDIESALRPLGMTSFFGHIQGGKAGMVQGVPVARYSLNAKGILSRETWEADPSSVKSLYAASRKALVKALRKLNVNGVVAKVSRRPGRLSLDTANGFEIDIYLFFKDTDPGKLAALKASEGANMNRTARLMKRQEKVLQKYLDSAGSRAVSDYDSLPSSVRSALERIKDGESLWSDVERWLGDNNNPHLARWAKKELPEALKKNQFTSEDNPNPKGNDKDGDGKTNEPSPVPKKAAQIKVPLTFSSPDLYWKPKKKNDRGYVDGGAAVSKWMREQGGGRELTYIDGKLHHPKGDVVINAPGSLVGQLTEKKNFRLAADSKKGALIRLAATLPVGSSERKTILRLASE